MSLNPISSKDRLESIVTPIWDEKMGRRLKIIRMKNLMTQGEFGKLLGIQQNTVHQIEAGKVRVSRKPFTLATLRAILGPHLNFVLYGSGAENYATGHISDTYWKTKLKREPMEPGTRHRQWAERKAKEKGGKAD